MQKNLIFQRNHPNFPILEDETVLENFAQNESFRILKEFAKNQKDSYFVTKAKRALPEFLKNIQIDSDPNIEAFILLQIELLKWAETHNLDKDWLLRYAYYFLEQFSNNWNLKISEVEIGYLPIRSLPAIPFKFNFDG